MESECSVPIHGSPGCLYKGTMTQECQQVPDLPCRALSRSWTVKQQCVDLLAEGLWEELPDDEQPDITVMDWYAPCPVSLPHPVTHRAHLSFPGVSLSPRPSCHCRIQPCLAF